MSPRKKPTFTPIANLDEFKDRLAEIAQIDRELTAIDHMMNETIDQAKAEADQAAEPLNKQRQQIEASLAAYAEYNKAALFDGKKTIELLFGSFGFRKSTAIKPIRGLRIADVINKIKQAGLKNAIRVKESLNKDVMGEWSDTQLESVGAMRDEKDSFWYEVKTEGVNDG